MRYLFSILLLFSNLAVGQVCCSLVGAANGNRQSNVLNAHYPTSLDFNKNMRWNMGFNTNIPYNGDLNIQYKFSGSAYSEISGYIFDNTIGHINSNLNFSNISESLSFEQTQTSLLRTDFTLGLRHKINEKLGYLNTSISLPLQPKYFNKDFLFRTGVVSTVSINWLNTVQYNISDFHSNLNFGLGINKNIKEKSDVFLDDRLSIFLSSVFNIGKLQVLPNIDVNYQKLLAPLSPYDVSRQERWLGTFSIGVNIIPMPEKWNWMQIDVNIPIYGWASEIGFPDGTQPVPSFSLSVHKNGLLGVKQKSEINIFE